MQAVQTEEVDHASMPTKANSASRKRTAYVRGGLENLLLVIDKQSKKDPAIWRLLMSSDEEAAEQLRDAMATLDCRGGVPLPYLASILVKLADAVYEGAVMPWKRG